MVTGDSRRQELESQERESCCPNPVCPRLIRIETVITLDPATEYAVDLDHVPVFHATVTSIEPSLRLTGGLIEFLTHSDSSVTERLYARASLDARGVDQLIPILEGRIT
jgi:hypothetical protein